MPRCHDIPRVALVLATLLACRTATAVTGPRSTAPVHLRTEHAEAPLDVDVAAPRFSWQLRGERGDVVQHAYQLVVATDPARLRAGRPDVWDSGQIASSAQTDVAYAGPPLASNAGYVWAVRVWNAAGGAPGAWSRPARFETGLLAPTDWTAAWIGRDTPATPPQLGEQAPAPLLRKGFTLHGSVARARLRVAGLGLHVVWINGRRVGEQVLAPPPSTFDRTALYATYDVTPLLRRGRNALGVMLGRGYFAAPFSTDLFQFATAPWRSEPRLLAQLDVTYADGATARIVSDGSWTMADGPVTDAFRVGERHDARREIPGWTRPAFDDGTWSPATVQPSPTERLRAMAMEHVEITDTLRPVTATTPAPHVTVYDFGKVTAGWVQLATQGAAGTTLTIRYGETLEGGRVAMVFDGHVDAYTLRGGRRETWEPGFTRHGFRYVEVESDPAPPRLLRVRARVNHTAVRSTGTFASGNDLLNRLQANQRASLLDNLWGFPTDTPWRDRMGWTADAWLFLDSAAFNFDVQRLYAQWLRSYRDAQHADGTLPVVVPAPNPADATNDDPSWAGTIVLDAWALYDHYGDRRLLEESWDAMARWMDHMDQAIAGTGDLWTGFSFGDWASPGAEKDGAGLLAPPEGPALTANADLYQEARTLARIATVLERHADAARYEALAARIAAAFNAAFLDPATNVYRTARDVGYRQTSNLMPLVHGLVPPEREAAVYANLVADVRARGNHLNTGAIGTKHLLPLLTDRRDGELAWAIVTQTTYPSWGYWLTQGATTSWETWDHTGVFQSLNHAFLGTFDDWLWRYLAGIQLVEPGWAAVRIRPFVPDGLDHAAASVDTPRGVIAAAWSARDDGLVLTVDVPGNVAAEVHVPATIDDAITTRSRGTVRLARHDADYTVYTAGSGRSVFTVRRAAR